jgi:hypothetical protein
MRDGLGVQAIGASRGSTAANSSAGKKEAMAAEGCL